MSQLMPLTDASLLATNHQTELNLLPFLAENLAKFRLHKCQVSHALISQHEPMKLIYHYERLDDTIKDRLPLQGQLLMDFDKPMTREMFAQKAGITLAEVAQPWQLKFIGKIVLFCEQPEIALRLHWTNTLKPFDVVMVKELLQAVEHSFANWQLIDSVEVISKDPNLRLTINNNSIDSIENYFDSATTPSNTASHIWQLQGSQAFVPLPSAVAIALQAFLANQAIVKDTWLSAMQQAAEQYASEWQDQLN